MDAVLPGEDLIQQGLADLNAGNETSRRLARMHWGAEIAETGI